VLCVWENQANALEAEMYVCYNIYNHGVAKSEVMTVIYTIEQLKERIAPIAEKYRLRAVWVFGSYARNEASENSDVDFLIDRTGSAVHSLFHLGGVYNDLGEAVGKPIDLITTAGLAQESTEQMSPGFADSIYKERKTVYERQ
jgi:predicted nucleotidyltransferase